MNQPFRQGSFLGLSENFWQFRIRCDDSSDEKCDMIKKDDYKECLLCKKNKYFSTNVTLQEEQIANKSW